MRGFLRIFKCVSTEVNRTKYTDMDVRVAINVLLIFCGGSVTSWALISWLNREVLPNKIDGIFIVIVGLVGLLMLIIGFASQLKIKRKEN
jgi:hypothetical protein